MASVNKVIVLGNLGARPEVRYTSNGVAVANISVATTRSWKKQDGQKAEETEWHRIVFYGRLAEVVGEYLDKGSSVYVEGRLRTRSWDDNGTTRYVTEVIADNMQMLGSANSQEQVDSKASPNKGAQNEYAKQSGSSARPTQSQQMKQQPSKQSQQNFDDMDDDIPF